MTNHNKPTPSAPTVEAVGPECAKRIVETPEVFAAADGIVDMYQWNNSGDRAQAHEAVRIALSRLVLDTPSGSVVDEGVEQVREALQHAKTTFYRYAQLHRAKETDEGDRKACDNASMGEEMSHALEALAHLSAPSPTLTVDADQVEQLVQRASKAAYDEMRSQGFSGGWDHEALVRVIVRTLAPAIRDQAFEEAARVADERAVGLSAFNGELMMAQEREARCIAHRIRALKGTPPSAVEDGHE